MRNLKRALSLALALVMVLSMMVVGAGAVSVDDFSDGADIVNKEAVTVLATLNVINGKEDGSYDPTGNVTRGEMAKMICVILNGGSDPVLGETITNSYTDTASHWAKSFIEYCTTLGIVAGKGDGTFDPNGNVTVAEAGKMVLVALGYNAGVEGYTGANWQINTDVRANALGLYDDLDYTNTSAALTRDNAAQMLYNALDVHMVVYDYIITGTVENAITTKPQLNDQKLGTLLWEKFGAVKVVGEVVANEYAVLDSTREDADKAPAGTVIGSHLDDGKTTVKVTNFEDGDQTIYNNREWTFSVSTGEAELGKAVYMYVKPASNSSNSLKATVIGSANISDENTIVTDASGDTVLDVADDNSLELTDDTVYAYNYAELDSAPKADKNGWTGIQKTLVDTDSDGDVDYVLLKEQGLGKVTLYSTAKDGQIVVAINRGNYVNDDSADIVGFEDVAKDDYVLTAYIGGRLYVQTAETVTGTIDAYKQTDGDTKGTYRNTGFTIDGTAYDVSRVFTYAGDITAAVDEVDKTILGSDATFYLDVNGNVIAYGEVEETAYKYAYIWGAEAGGSIDTDRVKATLEDGTTKTYDLDEDSEIDIESGSDNLTYHTSSKDYTIGEDTIDGLVFAYTLTSSGEIKLSLPRGGAVKSDDADKDHPTFTKELTNIRFLNEDTDEYVDAAEETNLRPDGLEADRPAETTTYYSNNATTFFYVSYENGKIDAVDVYNGRNNAPSLDGKSGTALLALNTRDVVAAAVFDNVNVSESAGDHMFVYDANYVWQDYGYVDAYFNGEDTAQENVQVAYVDHLGGDIEHNPDVEDGIYLYRYNTDGYYEITDPTGEPYYKTGVVSRVNKATNTFVVVNEDSNFKWEFKLTDDSVVVDYDSSHSSPVAYMGGTVAEGDVVQVIINNEDDSEVLMAAIMDREDNTTGGGVVVDNNITVPARGGDILYAIHADDLADVNIDKVLDAIENKLSQDYTIENTSYDATDNEYIWRVSRNDVSYTFYFDVDTAPASSNWDIYVTVTVNGTKKAVKDETTIADLKVAESGQISVTDTSGTVTYEDFGSTTPVVNGYSYSATEGFVNATINGEPVRVQAGTTLEDYNNTLSGWVKVNDNAPKKWVYDFMKDHVIAEGEVIITNLQEVTFGTNTTTYTGDGSVVWELNGTVLTAEEMAAKIFMGADDVLTCTVTTDAGFKASAVGAALTATGANFTITAEVTDEYTGTAPATVNGAAVEYVNGNNYWDGAVTFTFTGIAGGDSEVKVTESNFAAIS
ncbi:S-layer homology domain-containing protein [uncultured Intestinimonas sp.]|uniref:S-layer homology domain-containing protein n=1 Tax=uncultured Intestinimonas sp. TaxID=1689265 RepID=UPI0025CF183E|nr:S-layer homology domain-containing protein [uncultured Intestinimonas sp.]